MHNNSILRLRKFHHAVCCPYGCSFKKKKKKEKKSSRSLSLKYITCLQSFQLISVDPPSTKSRSLSAGVEIQSLTILLRSPRKINRSIVLHVRMEFITDEVIHSAAFNVQQVYGPNPTSKRNGSERKISLKGTTDKSNYPKQPDENRPLNLNRSFVVPPQIQNTFLKFWGYP